MLPEAIIKAARELDPSFDARRHTDRVALGYLARLHRRLIGEWAKIEQVSFIEIFTATFPLDDFAAGAPLLEDEPESGESVAEPLAITAIQRPADIYLEGHTEPGPIDVIPWGDRLRRRGRACYIEENALKFTGRAEDYTDVVRVELTYTPTPGAVEKGVELLLPLSAEDALVTGLGAFFAKRSKQEELARARREYLVDALDAETLWLDELRGREGAIVSRTREVW